MGPGGPPTAQPVVMPYQQEVAALSSGQGGAAGGTAAGMCFQTAQQSAPLDGGKGMTAVPSPPGPEESCPGFDDQGVRVAGAWYGGQLTQSARDAWKTYICRHNLEASREASLASPGGGSLNPRR